MMVICNASQMQCIHGVGVHLTDRREKDIMVIIFNT